MRTIILAGGKGSRLSPLTATRPASLLPVLRQPMLENVLHWVTRNGLDDIIIALGNHGPALRQAMSPFEAEANIRFAECSGSDTNPLNSLMLALRDYPTTEPFLVVPSNLITNIDLKAVLDFFAKAPYGMVVSESRESKPHQVVVVDREGHLRKIVTKPNLMEHGRLINTGIFVLTNDTLQTVLTHCQATDDLSHDFIHTWDTLGYPIQTYHAPGYVRRVQTIHQYQTVHYDLLNGVAKLPWLPVEEKKGFIAPSASISPRARIINPVWIDDNVVIEDDCIIGPFAVVGPDTHIQQKSHVSRSILDRKNVVSTESWLHGTVWGQNVVGDGQIVVENLVVVGDHSMIGWRAHLQPGARLAPKTFVPAGNQYLPQHFTLHKPHHS